MCAMLLSDLGAEVLRLERHGGTGNPNPVLTRGRAGLELDFKDSTDIATCLAATDRARSGPPQRLPSPCGISRKLLTNNKIQA